MASDSQQEANMETDADGAMSPARAAAAAAAAALPASSRGSDRTVSFLEESLLPASSAYSRGTLRGAGAGILGASGDRSGQSVPGGWPGHVTGAERLSNQAPLSARGGLFEDEHLKNLLSYGDVTALPTTSGGTADAAEASLGAELPTSPSRARPDILRPDTPILMFVDRASFPGFADPEENEAHFQTPAQDSPVQQKRSAFERELTRVDDDEWEAELLEWKRKYGCPDALAADADAGVTAASNARDTGTSSGAQAKVELMVQLTGLPTIVESSSRGEDSREIVRSVEAPSELAARAPEPQFAPQAIRAPSPTSAPVLEATETPPAARVPPMEAKRSSEAEIVVPFSPPLPPGAPPAARPQSRARALVAAGQPGAAAAPLQKASPAATSDSTALALKEDSASRDIVGTSTLAEAERTLAPTYECDVTSTGVFPASSPGRRYLYTAEDLEIATTTARSRLGPGGAWRSAFSESGAQKIDFFADLRKQRQREKGRQATGPLWVHLASQAKQLASQLDLGELLEAMKLFCSVRYEDYELFMRLLGEMTHYMGAASAYHLCELIRLLARRRLRERNYVDMIAAQLLKKIRLTDDALPARMLVKTANAFSSLECRGQPKFVEHFLRHMEHRIEELDGSLCALVSPLCVSAYMTDSLRCAYLKRCAETQAGFEGEKYNLRNMAVTELLLRKEHHSFVTALPSYVGRYLEKVRMHAQFDQWGSVALPSAVAPSGPKGADRLEMSLAIQNKSSATVGGSSADVFSSQMHRDVSACLSHLGIVHENGAICGPYLLDIVATDMVNPAKRIVYEVNSPHHYYEGTELLIAEQRLRHRLLGRLGHKLHMVHAHDWRPLTSAQKMNFILKLQDAQQEENAKEFKRQAAANVARAPLPALQLDAAKQRDPRQLKSKRDLSAKLRVPVPPSQRGLSLTAR